MTEPPRQDLLFLAARARIDWRTLRSAFRGKNTTTPSGEKARRIVRRWRDKQLGAGTVAPRSPEEIAGSSVA